MKKVDKKNRKLLKMYFRIVLVTVLVLSSVFWLVGKAVVLLAGERASGPSNIFYDESLIVEEEEETDDSSILKPPAKTNFLILAVDKHELLTDVMMAGSFERDSQIIDIISIPRDTYTEFSTQETAKMNAAGIYPPDHMKMNAVHSYTKEEFGVTFIEEHLEEFLGVEFDFYVKVNVDAFKELVDAIGGIDFYVPMNMYYDDPYQDLHIHLEEGMQHLNGEEAEGLVRFRKNNDNTGYAMGDIQRIQVQQDFMKTVFEKVLSMETLLTKPLDLANVFLDNVETDFSISDMPKYVPYISGLSTEKLNMYTMPYDEQATSVSDYVIPDVSELSELVNTIFYSDRNIDVESEDEIYTKKIQILNGSRTNGLASETADKLTELGFVVANYGNYNGEYTNETVIKVKPGTNATKLQALFENSTIEYTLRDSDTYDVVVILGLNEEGIGDIEVSEETEESTENTEPEE